MAEKEYIEREAVINFANNHITKSLTINDIARFPAADVAPVRHGHWIEQENWASYDYYYTCSVCGEDYNTIDGSPDYNYCPNCGAYMRGDESE